MGYHIQGMTPAPPSTMDEPGGQKPSSLEVGYHIRGMISVPPSTMDELGRQKPSSGKVGYHIRGTVLAPPLMTALGEESWFVEADCHTRNMVPAPLLTTEPGAETGSFLEDCHTRGTTPAGLSITELAEGSSPWEVDFHTRDTAPSPIVRRSGLRMDSRPPQAGREVPAHAHALMGIASGVAVVGLALQVERMAPGTSGLNCLADTGRMAARRVRHSPNAERDTEVVGPDEVPLAYRGMSGYVHDS